MKLNLKINNVDQIFSLVLQHISHLSSSNIIHLHSSLTKYRRRMGIQHV